MTRTYKHKVDTRRGRMLRAVRMHAEGMSLRQIAQVLGVHHDTVWRDLQRWADESATVTRLSDHPVGNGTPRGDQSDSQQARNPTAPIVPLRRRA